MAGDDDFVIRPEHSEWDRENIQEELERVLMIKCQIPIKVWDDEKIKSYFGTIESIELHNRCIMLHVPFDLERLKFKDIVSVQVGY